MGKINQNRFSDIPKNSKIYLLCQRVIGAIHSRRRYIEEYVRPIPNQRVLDVGCGPGYVVEYFPKSDYIGLDINERYIQYVSCRYGWKGQFFAKS